MSGSSSGSGSGDVKAYYTTQPFLVSVFELKGESDITVGERVDGFDFDPKKQYIAGLAKYSPFKKRKLEEQWIVPDLARVETRVVEQQQTQSQASTAECAERMDVELQQKNPEGSEQSKQQHEALSVAKRLNFPDGANEDRPPKRQKIHEAEDMAQYISSFMRGMELQTKTELRELQAEVAELQKLRTSHKQLQEKVVKLRDGDAQLTEERNRRALYDALGITPYIAACSVMEHGLKEATKRLRDLIRVRVLETGDDMFGQANVFWSGYIEGVSFQRCLLWLVNAIAIVEDDYGSVFGHKDDTDGDLLLAAYWHNRGYRGTIAGSAKLATKGKVHKRLEVLVDDVLKRLAQTWGGGVTPQELKLMFGVYVTVERLSRNASVHMNCVHKLAGGKYCSEPVPNKFWKKKDRLAKACEWTLRAMTLEEIQAQAQITDDLLKNSQKLPDFVCSNFSAFSSLTQSYRSSLKEVARIAVVSNLKEAAAENSVQHDLNNAARTEVLFSLNEEARTQVQEEDNGAHVYFKCAEVFGDMRWFRADKDGNVDRWNGSCWLHVFFYFVEF